MSKHRERSQSPRTRGEVVSNFLSRCGIWNQPSPKAFWNHFEKQFGHETSIKYSDQINFRHPSRTGSGYEDFWNFIYANLSVTQAMLGFERSKLVAVMNAIFDANLPPGNVIDLGCGSGIFTCFFAFLRPDSHVVGVDFAEQSLDSARSLASRLGLTNVTFDKIDLAKSISVSGSYYVVFSCTVAHEMESRLSDSLKGLTSFSEYEGLFLNPTFSNLTSVASSMIGRSGKYVSIERIPATIGLATWISSHTCVGLSIDWGASRFIRWSSVGSVLEHLPMIVSESSGKRNESPEFYRWHAQQYENENSGDAEIWFFEAGPHQILKGFHAETLDQFGAGQVQTVIVQSSTDQVITYQANTRGVRRIVSKRPISKTQVSLDEFASIRRLFVAAPDVKVVKDFSSDSDFAGPPLKKPCL